MSNLSLTSSCLEGQDQNATKEATSKIINLTKSFSASTRKFLQTQLPMTIVEELTPVSATTLLSWTTFQPFVRQQHTAPLLESLSTPSFFWSRELALDTCINLFLPSFDNAVFNDTEPNLLCIEAHCTTPRFTGSLTKPAVPNLD